MPQETILTSRLAGRLNGGANGARPDGAQVPPPAPDVAVVTTRGPAWERSALGMDFDNLLRNRLRISDPKSPEAIAQALRSLYPLESARMTREVQGLPVAFERTAPARIVVASSDDDVRDVTTMLEHDLNALVETAVLAEIQSELRAWTRAVRTAFGTGLAAATAGIDPHQRRVALASRRALTDFARLARLCAALNPGAWTIYRQVAQTMDEASGVLLVRLGQAVATAGRTIGRTLATAPAAELQALRHAAIAALRQLAGSGEKVASADGWPRGMLAHRQLEDALRTGGFSELGTLLDEASLGRLLDDLIDATIASAADGVRSTTVMELQLDSLRRLALLCQLTAPDSSSVSAFTLAIQRLLDAFEASRSESGYRLQYVARPALLFARRVGNDAGVTDLMELTTLRRRLSDSVENFVGYEFGDDDRTGQQVGLDACLQYLDYATDLYLIGTNTDADGPPERRAMTFGYVAHVVQRDIGNNAGRQSAVRDALRDMRDILLPGPDIGDNDYAIDDAPERLGDGRPATVERELSLLFGTEQRMFELARRLSPSYATWSAGESPMLEVLRLASEEAGMPLDVEEFMSNVPPDIAVSLNRISERLPNGSERGSR